jgi:hypothetical protein
MSVLGFYPVSLPAVPQLYKVCSYHLFTLFDTDGVELDLG